LTTLVQQLRTFHGNLDPGRRLTLYAVLVLAVAAVIGVGFWSSRTSWQPMVSGSSYDEVLEAAAALDGMDITYRIDDRGQLLVSASDVGRARAAMTEADVLPGLTDVSELKLGLTPQAQAWAFQRAKEGDLARMINGIDGVSASRVHVVPRRESLFIDEIEPARASVFLKLRPNSDLDAGQVRAIANLVANSVDGLGVDHVSVVDDRGTLLATGASANAGGELGEEPMELLEYRQKVERSYEQAVSKAILPILGYGNGFSVTANVDLDTATTETVSRVLDTEKQALISEVFEESESADTKPGGVPGVDANLPERAVQTGATGGKSTRTASTTNFDYPSDVQTIIRPAGDIKRVSVAVQVDSAAVTALAEAASVPVEQIQDQLTQAVQASVGYDAERNDIVSVHVMPFAEGAWVEETAINAPVSATAIALTVAPHAIAALGLVLLFLFVIRPMMGMLTRPDPKLETAHAGIDGAGPPRTDDPDADLADRLRLLVDNYQPVDATDLNRLVTRESAAAAHVLRQWKANGE